MDKVVVFEGFDHEVDAACDVALEDRVAHMATPNGQPLAVALLKAAAPHDGPARVAGEDASGRLDLVVEVDDAREAA